jgi:hypothetical protein
MAFRFVDPAYLPITASMHDPQESDSRYALIARSSPGRSLTTELGLEKGL